MTNEPSLDEEKSIWNIVLADKHKHQKRKILTIELSTVFFLRWCHHPEYHLLLCHHPSIPHPTPLWRWYNYWMAPEVFLLYRWIVGRYFWHVIKSLFLKIKYWKWLDKIFCLHYDMSWTHILNDSTKNTDKCGPRKFCLLTANQNKN